jgi:1-acyl-sn-glycerol-3-phosphate acyltransferase
MSFIFQSIYHLISRYRLLSLIVLLVVLGGLGWTASKLNLTEDISQVLPKSEAIDNMSFVLSNSRFLDKVVIHFSMTDTVSEAHPEKLSRFADQLADSLTAHAYPEWLTSIDKAPDNQSMLELYQILNNYLPLLLDSVDYRHLEELIEREQIRNTLKANYATLISPVGMATKKMISSDPLHVSVMGLNKIQTFNINDGFELYNRYFLSSDQRHLLLLITPLATNNTSTNQQLFDLVDRYIAGIQQSGLDDVQVSYFGNPVVALGNAQRIKSDIMLTVSLALLSLMLVITLVFRRKRTFFIIFLPVLFGALLSLAVISLVKGEVSAISLGIGSVLLGISVDYALHIYSHFRQNQSRKNLYSDLATPILLSSFTTMSAFFTLLFVNSGALNDLGLFAGVSVIGAALFSLIVLPHLMPNETGGAVVHHGFIDRLASVDLSKKKGLGWLIVVLTIVFAFTMQEVGFDADMMKNNYMSEKLKQAENQLNVVTSLSKKTIYLVTPGEDETHALEANQRVYEKLRLLEKQGLVEHAAVVNDLLPSPTAQKLAQSKWTSFWRIHRDSVQTRLLDEGAKLGFRAKAFDGFLNWIEKPFNLVNSDSLGDINDLFLDNYFIRKDTITAIINVVKVNNDEATIQAVYDEFDTDPSVWVIDKRKITSDFVNILKDNFNRLVWISILLVFIILLVAYGRIELTLITMIPMVASWIWTVGLMGLLGIEFNIFNVIILTFIFGLGIDYSIFMMRGLLQEYKYGHHDLSAYKISIILSGITTLLGIGVLIFAQHPALKSIALMSIIGILSVIFITFTLLPKIFRWLVTYSGGLRNRPVNFIDYIFSLWALFVFVTGSFLLSLLALLLPLIPVAEEKKKLFHHRMFRALTWFMIYMNFLSKKTIINPDGEDFSQPSVVIANHQSHVDLMMLLLLTPRLVVLTNSRNYVNPMYGKALQYAGFIEVSGDYDKVIDQVREQVNMGYSVAIFPEGHRTETGEVMRFHKGAFYLANELGLDILPILLAGQRECLKKSELLLKRGAQITRFLPRIDLKLGEYGTTPRDQAKQVRNYVRNEFNRTLDQLQSPAYLRDFIVKNYMYKGPILEWYTRIKLRLENNYAFFDELIPKQASITDLGCGYGYLAYMLALRSKGRTIIGVDYDAEKIAVANHCAIKTDKVSFLASDILDYQPESTDVYVLNDVLHYLPQQKQVEVVEKCIAQMPDHGLIIIRDADVGLKKRHLGTRITEFFSTHLGFNKTQFKLDFVSRQLIIDLALKHKLKLDIIDNTKRTSNLVYLLRRR